MQTRRLGRTDLNVAPLVFGGNVFGWTADKKTSFDVLDRFAAAGLNAIDTADVYSAWAPGNSGGESEMIIGDWMKARGNRNRVIIITKVGSPMGKGKEGLSARYVAEAVEASLKRLQVDAIDLYLSHWPDMATPIDETLGAYQRLIKEGKIRWCGASNLSVKLLEAALAASKAKGCRAMRFCSRNTISPTVRNLMARCRALPARADRRHHLFQPRQGVPHGQVPQRGRSLQKSARGRGQGLSQPAWISDRRRARSSGGQPQSKTGGGRAGLGDGEARRHRADRQRHLSRTDREFCARNRACVDGRRHGRAQRRQRGLDRIRIWIQRRRSIWVSLVRRRFATNTPDFEGWISLDFLGFSRPKRDLSMGYTGFSLEEISHALCPRVDRPRTGRQRF